jgi:hypothetical protein
VRLAIAALGGRSAERRASFVEPPAQEPLGSSASDVISPAVPEHLSTLFATGPQVINGCGIVAEQLAACSRLSMWIGARQRQEICVSHGC